MAETVKIEADKLYPGDIIRFDFEVRSANQTLVGLAVSDIKKAIWSDDRLDYQGSDSITQANVELGRDVEILRIYAKVRRYRRAARPVEQQAGIIGPIMIASVVAMVTAAVVAWSGSIKERGYTIQRIASDPNLSDEAKQKAFEAMGERRSISSGITALGGSLVTAAVIIGVLWALSLSRPARSAD